MGSTSRLRPLHTCGVSFLAIAHSACARAQNLNGRLGSTTRKMVRVAKLVNPLIFVLQYYCFMALSFIDDRLLAIENMVEKTFPSSRLVLDKIDDTLHLIETFPLKFDDAVDKLPCFNQVLLLDWVVTHAISLLKFMINILMNCGRDVTGEKEISVDMNYNGGRKGFESADKSKCCSKGTVSSVFETQPMKGTYKEVLKMGTDEKGTYKMEEGTRNRAVEDKEDCKNEEKGTAKKVEKGLKAVEDTESSKKDEKKEESVEKAEEKDENNESHTAKIEESVEKAEGNEEIADQSREEKEEEGVMDDEYEDELSNYGSIEENLSNYGNTENEEDILELFETAWLMKPTRKGKENGMSRSASFV